MANPLLNTWIAYVNRLKEDPYGFLLHRMTKRYKPDEITTILAAASDNDRTSNIAKMLKVAVSKRKKRKKTS